MGKGLSSAELGNVTMLITCDGARLDLMVDKDLCLSSPFSFDIGARVGVESELSISSDVLKCRCFRLRCRLTRKYDAVSKARMTVTATTPTTAPMIAAVFVLDFEGTAAACAIDGSTTEAGVCREN